MTQTQGTRAADNSPGTTPDSTPVGESELSIMARTYAYIGWYVFPCVAGTKKPRTRHGYKDATTDEKQIRRWWEQYPDDNIGIACDISGLVVLDLDPRNGALESIQGLRRLPEITSTVITRDNGLHLYYRGTRSTGKKLEGYPGIDIKWRGFTIAPPSFVDVDGISGYYRWSMTPSERWTDEEAPWPSWIDNLCPKPRQRQEPDNEFAHILPATGAAYSFAALRNEVQRVLDAVPGGEAGTGRNDTLNRATYSLWQLVLSGALDGPSVSAALVQAARYVGLEDWEIDRTMRSAMESATPRLVVTP